MLLDQKNQAIQLRKKGFSYSEILKDIPVAKSTLSGWLHSVGLSKKQKQRLTEKKMQAILRGAARKREIRIEQTKNIMRETAKEIGLISDRELFLLGVIVYWAEGSKQKEHAPGSGVQFSNSDPKLIKLFLYWLLKICKISKGEIDFEIYIHQNRKDIVIDAVKFWSKVTKFPESYFSRVYFKKGSKKTNRKNIGNLYFGQVKIRVRKSSILNRKIAGWMEGVIECLK